MSLKSWHHRKYFLTVPPYLTSKYFFFKISLYIYSLLVRGDRKPEIFPKTSVYPIREYNSITITCKAQGIVGQSFLKWYRRYYGSYVYVDDNKIQRTKEIIGGNQVDVEKLVFREFTTEDQGEYVCVRKVAGSKPTTASIRLTMRWSLKFVVLIGWKLHHEETDWLTSKYRHLMFWSTIIIESFIFFGVISQ